MSDKPTRRHNAAWKDATTAQRQAARLAKLDNAHLRTPDSSTVRIVKEMTFRIYVNGVLAHESDSNSAACAFLYREEVGIATER